MNPPHAIEFDLTDELASRFARAAVSNIRFLRLLAPTYGRLLVRAFAMLLVLLILTFAAFVPVGKG